MSNVPQIITELVEKFERNFHEYKSPKFNETLIRVEFVNPFWKALGWDVNNEQGYALAYRDVIHEDELKVGRTSRAPDYAFRIGGTRKFFLETKKPAVDLKHDPAPAFQLRRYAYSARLPISMLTDFEEFIVYDCRNKPTITDKPHIGRMMYYTFREYLEKWDEINGLFSKKAVMQGTFDLFVEDKQGKRPRAEIDRDFLSDLDKWRITFARNIALRNPELTERELNYVVQLTIDRLIFLRMCEDRDIEQYETLMALLNGVNVYRRLVEFYYKADARYNSGLFHFEEKDGAHPDILTPKINIDDKVLKEIIAELYYPKCPYEFSVLPVEVLGNAYEQFLGKRITLTEGHRARIEEKPEVRKAGGVYYTPQYIVDYIVKNTVGKLCENKTVRDVSEICILDPACGSGSFLLGAYQYLLDWHLNSYRTEYERTGKIPTSPPTKGKRKRKSDPQAIFQGKGGEWYLTTAEKKRILTNNIYGVDIDANAVEVSKLSLLLKVLEHETSETLNLQLGLWKERALPNLENNIKCGNSLIGTDFYESRQAALFNEEEVLRINAFDWEQEFVEIFDRGGFDAVIGNPPYIRIQVMKEWASDEVKFYKSKYKSAITGNYDIYVIFVEKGIFLCNVKGRLGYILPNKFFTTDYGMSLRNILAEKNYIEKIVDFGHKQVFPQATTYTCLLFLNKLGVSKFEYKKVEEPILINNNKNKNSFLDAETLTSKPWILIDNKQKKIVDKLFSESIKLIDLPSKISRGSSSGADNIFMLKKIDNQFEDRSGRRVIVENEILRKPIYATDFGRYYFAPNNNEFIIFPYQFDKENYTLIEENKFKKNYPLAYNYLLERKNELKKRKQYKEWYSFSAPRNLKLHDTANYLVPLLADKGSFCLINDFKNYCLMASGGFSIKVNKNISLYYIIGILNSKLVFWWLRNISNKFRGGWITCTKQYVGQLPMKIIDFEMSGKVILHDRIVCIVKKLIEIIEKLEITKDLHTRELFQRQIDATDRQIDQLVYQLYGLTEEEIRIVEANDKD
jgi:type I restriction-modification system DNA methylase subunit